MALRQQQAARLKKIPNLALRDGRRILSNLGGGVPKRHVERADRDAALPVTARLFSGHHYLPCAKGVEIGPAASTSSASLALNKRGANHSRMRPPLREATKRSETVTDYRLRIANPRR
jgi:hypothetical protein